MGGAVGNRRPRRGLSDRKTAEKSVALAPVREINRSRFPGHSADPNPNIPQSLSISPPIVRAAPVAVPLPSLRLDLRNLVAECIARRVGRP